MACRANLIISKVKEQLVSRANKLEQMAIDQMELDQIS